MDNNKFIEIQREFGREISRLKFSTPVTHVYNPLEYAWEPYKKYLQIYGRGEKHTVFLGMNPGPWGMLQTGIPFGEIDAVKNWLGISGKVAMPKVLHPARPVEGYSCGRHEISGMRLWKLFENHFGKPGRFFRGHFVLNYCPLAFFNEKGTNITPDKLPAKEGAMLFSLCDAYLSKTFLILHPHFAVGIGRFAEARIRKSLEVMKRDREDGQSGKNRIDTVKQISNWSPGSVKVAHILHPSPASPAANTGWEAKATAQLIGQGIWN